MRESWKIVPVARFYGPLVCLLGTMAIARFAAAQTDGPAPAGPASTGPASTGPATTVGVVEAAPHLPSAAIAEVFRSIGSTENAGLKMSTSDNPSMDQASGDSVGPLIEQLGAPEFARREQATAQLHQLGTDAVPLLNQVASEHPDIEVRIRAKDIVTGISSGETEGRIDEFLLGKEVPLEGWLIFRKIVGDGTKVREIFVELLLRHRDVLMSLEGTSKDRTDALLAVHMRIQRGLTIERRMPSNADVFAAFLLANDPQVTLSPMDEISLIRISSMDAASRLNVDTHLSGPFRALVGGWVLRSGQSDRNEQVLWVALSWDLQEALVVALDMLSKNRNPQSMASAMQVISRFGDVQQIEKLTPYLDDKRPATEPRFAGDAVVDIQLGDVAAAAIVLMSGKKLGDYGMSDTAWHSRFGVNIDELGFSTEDKAAREKSRAKVKLLIEE